MKRTYGMGLAVALGLAMSAAAQQAPTVTHAELTTRAAGSLRAEIDSAKKESGTVWVGYSVPTVDKFSNGWGEGHVAYLEGDRHTEGGEKKQQMFDHANVLLRASGGAVDKVRLENPDRELDGGGAKFVWLTGVREEESIAVLADLARSEARRSRDSAVFAISVHKSGAATQALIALADPKEELGLREKAAFWLANERGAEGFAALKKFVHEDPDAKFREKLAFDLTLTKQPGAVDELLWMAKNDTEPRVRRQAQFWMATTAQRKMSKDVPAALREAANDPNAQVRKSAVFGISRLGEEGTPQLIELAKTSKDVDVRRQAIFWLGQSKDPRALAYLEQMLKQ